MFCLFRGSCQCFWTVFQRDSKSSDRHICILSFNIEESGRYKGLELEGLAGEYLEMYPYQHLQHNARRQDIIVVVFVVLRGDDGVGHAFGRDRLPKRPGQMKTLTTMSYLFVVFRL